MDDAGFVDPPGLPALLPAGIATEGEVELLKSLVLTSAVTVVSILISVVFAVVVRTVPKTSTIGSALAAAFAAVGLTYLGPNVVQYSATLLAHGSSSSVVGLAAACAGAVAVPMVTTCWVVWPPHSRANDGSSPSVRDRLREGVWSVFHEGSRDGSVLKLRMYFFEDLAVAVGLGALSGIHPTTILGCRAVAASMLVLGMVHLAYIVVVRPHAGRVDLAFAVGNAVVVSVIGVGVVIIVFLELRSAVEPLGYLLIAVDALVFVQLVVLGVIGAKEACSQGHGERGAGNVDPDGAGTSTATPLLVVPVASPPPAEAAAIHVNPLNYQ